MNQVMKSGEKVNFMGNKIMGNKIVLVLSFALALTIVSHGTSFSAPDYYAGDASVYTGGSVPPNIMLLFDISDNMTKTGSSISYVSDVYYIEQYEDLIDSDGDNYDSDYIPGRVYVQNTAGSANDGKMTLVDGNDGDYVECDAARNALLANGIWMGSLSKGECDNKSAQTYYSGDMASLMFELSQVPQAPWQNTETVDGVEVDKLYNVGDLIEVSISGVLSKFVCVQAGTPGSTEPVWTLDKEILILTNGQIVDGPVRWEPSTSALSMAASSLKLVAKTLGSQVRLGVAVLNENNQGADILQPLILTNNKTNLDAFNAKMDELAALNVSGNHWQVNEALWDLGTYFNGNTNDAISTKIKGETYANAAEYWCQSNNIILVTSGLDSDVSQTKGLVDNWVAEYTSTSTNIDETVVETTTTDIQGTSVDVAKHLYEKLVPDYLDTGDHVFRVKTHVLQVLSGYLEQLEQTAIYGGDADGDGFAGGVLADLPAGAEDDASIYESLDSAEALQGILADLISSFIEADSSFVAPVVPASPESRAYSGQRIYLGFFKPQDGNLWYGNIKKFGLNASNEITALDSSLATNSKGYFRTALNDPESVDFESLETDGGDPLVGSFWGTDLDGGSVDAGGVGALLKSRDTARNIKTVSSGSMISFSVAVDGTPSVSSALLEVDDDIEAAKLINFVHGYDTYAEDDYTTTVKRFWSMGDVEHSKPVVLNYSTFIPEADDDLDDVLNEDDSDVNDSIIFVGANDGMLHAFRDVDGSEAWAFIPPDLLPNLQYLTDTANHYYFVDNSPVVYVYDVDGDGNIDVGDGDKAILICGMRRGGGSSTITTGSQGSYFALDISDPESPTFMWQINAAMSDFAEMGQTWSLPRLTKMRVGTDIKVVAVFGAGYDTNEDLRYGVNQNFPDDTDGSIVTSALSSGAGDTVNGGTTGPYEPSGRGLYVVEVATINAGVPNLTNSGSLIRSFVYSKSPSNGMDYSIPSDPLVVDRDNDGYTDHIYIGDTGGQLWRFNIEDTDESNWTATRIFTANPGYDAAGADGLDVGRKIFYKPTATIYGDDTFIYFGTGDREHPLNTAVVDRFYVVRDRENEETNIWPLDESDLVDVTTNRLQEADFSPTYDGDGNPTNSDAQLLSSLTEPLYSDGTDTFYGWHIKLSDNPGEKVLATPKVFEGTAYFTTYEAGTGGDPCDDDRQLGTARLYAVKATTGEAVYNFDLGNDTTTTVDDETVTEEVLGRSDRSFAVGEGISSEPLIMINNKGAVSVMVGRGGGFFNSGTVESIDPVFPVYWMKW